MCVYSHSKTKKLKKKSCILYIWNIILNWVYSITHTHTISALYKGHHSQKSFTSPFFVKWEKINWSTMWKTATASCSFFKKANKVLHLVSTDSVNHNFTSEMCAYIVLKIGIVDEQWWDNFNIFLILGGIFSNYKKFP